MAAIWFRFRAELRDRWRPWFGLALLVGVAGGLVMGVGGGARRTDTSYSRFLESQNAWDVAVYNLPDEGTAVFDFDKVARLPQVVDSARADTEYLSLGGGQTAVAPVDDLLDNEINRIRILEGRAADQNQPGEAVIPFTVAEDFDLSIGDRLELYFDPEELRASLPAGQKPTREQREFLRYLRGLVAALPGGSFEIVGIEAAPSEFPPQFAGGAPVHLTPAFAEVHASRSGEMIAIQLRNGAADVAAFREELERRSRGEPVEMDVQADISRNTQRSIHQQAVSFWILTGLTALVGALILSQLLARQALLESSSEDVLSALGMSRRQRFILALARAGLVGIIGAIVAIAVAVLISPLMPTGLARIAEPDPGLAVDALALTIGTGAVVLAVVLLAAWPAWRATRTLETRAESGRLTAPSRLADALARMGASAPSTIGVRMAIEPGRGRRAVPVRTALAVVALGVAVLMATLVFGASLTHLLDTPRLYGASWDVGVSNYGSGPRLEREGVAVARELDGVTGISVADVRLALQLDGERIDGLAVDTIEGDATPPLLAGRSPENANEIVVGDQTRQSLGVDIGDRVEVQLSGSAKQRALRIVGVGVIPTVSEGASLGEGALLTIAGARQFSPRPDDGYALYLQLEPGVSEDTVIAELQQGLEARCDERPARCPRGSGFLAESVDDTPTDIVNFGRVRNMPLVLGAVLALLAAGTLTHVLISAVRRRRRDLALLRALGFERRQCIASVAWQANTIVLIGLLIGVPAGVALGRWIWTNFAEGLGILPVPRVPAVAVLVTIAGALLLANLIAVFPARAAARARPADVLRTE
jgi:ABC-type lipoprotein release transport system permease subunit